MKNKICVLIPARYKSKRLPGKPLITLKNKSILERTIEQVLKVIKKENIFVFTDSIKVSNHLRDKYLNIIFTKGNYHSGTDRCANNIDKINKKFNGYLIVSCDFPFISKKCIDTTIENYKKIFKSNNHAGATVHTKTEDQKVIKSSKIPKIVTDVYNDIIYISRSPLPSNYNLNLKYKVHHGPVCLKYSALKNTLKFKNKKLSKSEENEWLQFIENGYKIRTSEVSKISREINDIKDLNYYKRKLNIRN
tara:strand:+ start:1048 stop:1794 length:747 start_codon:yes stop_codon:yes gene_type:complete